MNYRPHMANRSRVLEENIEIWHWNCRTYQKRAAALQQFIKTSLTQPDIICLQEVGNKPVKLRDYYTYQDPKHSKVATLVRKNIATSIHEPLEGSTHHQIIEIHTKKRGKPKFFIVNIYSPPQRKRHRF